jgi:hypothetical protein
VQTSTKAKTQWAVISPEQSFLAILSGFLGWTQNIQTLFIHAHFQQGSGMQKIPDFFRLHIDGFISSMSA